MKKPNLLKFILLLCVYMQRPIYSLCLVVWGRFRPVRSRIIDKGERPNSSLWGTLG